MGQLEKSLVAWCCRTVVFDVVRENRTEFKYIFSLEIDSFLTSYFGADWQTFYNFVSVYCVLGDSVLQNICNHVKNSGHD